MKRYNGLFVGLFLMGIGAVLLDTGIDPAQTNTSTPIPGASAPAKPLNPKKAVRKIKKNKPAATTAVPSTPVVK